MSNDETRVVEYLLDKAVWFIILPIIWFWVKSIIQKLEDLTKAVSELRTSHAIIFERFNSQDKIIESHMKRLHNIETKLFLKGKQ